MNVEERVKDAFESLAREVDPVPGSWLQTQHRIETAHRRRLVGASSLTVVIAIVAAILVPKIVGSKASFDTPGSGWETYRHREYGWTLEHPASWHVQPVSETHFEFQEEGILLSNVDHEFRHPVFPSTCPEVSAAPTGRVVGPCGGFTSAWDMRGLPRSLVVIEFVHHPPFGPVPPNHASHCATEDTPLPLSLDQMVEFDVRPESAYGAPQPGRYLRLTGRGDDHYILRVHLGAEASRADVNAVRRVVASISFQNARPGLPGTPGVNCPSSPGT